VPRGQTGAVHLSFGHYANVIEIAGQGIAFSCDGVGSKTLIAQLLDKYDTIGIDCIAMNVNDILCVGATPVSLVDYIAVETAAPALLDELAIGLAAGAHGGISIAGGDSPAAGHDPRRAPAGLTWSGRDRPVAPTRSGRPWHRRAMSSSASPAMAL
jgi:phosphoribosylaminoimidazole (AIR) synthetase